MAPTPPQGIAGEPARSATTGVSCIVCTHNGAARIPAVLDCLARQVLPENVSFEIVLVDNASSDDTSGVAEEHWLLLGAPAPLVVISEPQAGLIHARKAGIQAARFEVLTFIDDDNWICQEWCGRVAVALDADQRLAAIGGRGVAYFEETVAPVWFERFQAAYAVGPQTNWRRGCATLSRLYGAGLSVRKSALEELAARGFSPVLAGRTGANLSAGDDSELCYALALAGWELGYDPDLVFQHVMPAKRLSESYLVELYKGFGACSATLDLYNWLSSRRRPNPIALAISFRVFGLLTCFAKLLYWRVRLVSARLFGATQQLEAQAWYAYFVYRFQSFYGNWGAAVRQAKAVYEVFFAAPNLSRNVSA